MTNHSVQGVTEKKNPVTGRQKGFDKKQTNRNMFSRRENMFLAKVYSATFAMNTTPRDALAGLPAQLRDMKAWWVNMEHWFVAVKKTKSEGGEGLVYLRGREWEGLRTTGGEFARQRVGGFVSRFELVCGVTSEVGDGIFF